MTLEELRDEYETERIGERILGEVERAVAVLIGKYDPRIYGGVDDWQEGREDLIQGIVTEMLLTERQLDYIFSQAITLDDYRGLLFYQAKRYLARNRRRTVIDNLLDRAEEILVEPPFLALGSRPLLYQLDGSDRENRSPRDDELSVAARYASVVPRVPFAVTERAPIVYSRANLRRLLTIVADRLPCTFSKNDLQRIFESLLTDWVPTFLEEVEEDQAAGELQPEDEAQVNEAHELIMRDLATDEAVILRAQVLNLPDRVVADELGTSRQTVIARRQKLLDRLRPVLSGLPATMQTVVLERVGVSLTMPHGRSPE